jgi:hypothetical protein
MRLLHAAAHLLSSSRERATICFVERLIMFGNESNSERRDWSQVEITPTAIHWVGLRTVSAMHVTALNALQ